MSYTIESAKYANPENTAAVLQTVESGAVAVSVVDRPVLWQWLQDWITVGNTCAAYTEPVPKAPEILEAECQAALDNGAYSINIVRLIKAAEIRAEALRLGKTPAQLTGQELLALRNGIANVYKNL